jgi:pantoate--beta-alanine ligase
MPPELIETISVLRERVAGMRATGAIGFVPTMGALHQGHASLLKRARAECATVVASIFVNPLQFDRADDLARYPRTLEADMAVCAAEGVDVVFAPTVAEMYPREPICAIDVGILGEHLCGRFRPGHFRGVATVVLKLLQMVGADVAYFGEKDAQQLAVVRRMVSDFNVPVRVEGVATVREGDGLAMSSRNARLTGEERREAPLLYRSLQEAARQIEYGVTDTAMVLRSARVLIPPRPGMSLEYLEIVDPETFQPIEQIDGPVIVAGALWIGGTRLIDNIRCEPHPAS